MSKCPISICTVAAPNQKQLRPPSAFHDAELVKHLNFVADVFAETERLSNRAQNALVRLQDNLLDFKVRQIKASAIAEGVWDFYPTPKSVVDKMLELADLQPHHHVLEPSAGNGDLVQAIALAGVKNQNIDCFEIHPLLGQALLLQQFNLIGEDFLMAQPNPIYDRIISNPPFSRKGIANHTIHAYNFLMKLFMGETPKTTLHRFLKPGGKLITISHHYSLPPSRSDKQFFAWLRYRNAKFLNLGNAFQSGDRPTSIPIQLILIQKP